MKKQYFTVGPSQLFFSVESHMKSALKNDIASISHRSKEFSAVVQSTVEKLRVLFDLPDSHHIAFTASATEIWERLIQNTVENESFHLINGAFSEKFARVARNYNINVQTAEADYGSCVDIEKILVPESTELIAITHNETSTGAAYPEDDIYKLAEAFAEQIIAVDMVSSAPAAKLDWKFVDTAYFSVQKAFGLPAGLGIWIYNDRCLEKSQELLNRQKIIGSYHSLPEIKKFMDKFQTPETPNMLNIYLLNKVIGDMLALGIDRIRRETVYKSAVLYQAIEENNDLTAFVKDDRYKSKTTIVAESSRALEIREAMKKRHMILGSGYSQYKNDHIRIANFPTHSKEQIEMLADFLIKA